METGFEHPTSLTEAYRLQIGAPFPVLPTAWGFRSNENRGWLELLGRHGMLASLLLFVYGASTKLGVSISPWWPILAFPLLVVLTEAWRWIRSRPDTVTLRVDPTGLTIGDQHFGWSEMTGVHAGDSLVWTQALDGTHQWRPALVIETRARRLAWQVGNPSEGHLTSLQARLQDLRYRYGQRSDVPARLWRIRSGHRSPSR